MKKIILSVIAGVILAGFSLPARAATDFSLSPNGVNAAPGQNFNVNVLIDPQGSKIYTLKAEIIFPAEFLKAESFSFGSGWMPLSQTGYDLIDNANGVLIKTAGYAGGIANAANFGTISFSAKKEGSGNIKIGNSSLALNASSQNDLSSFPQISFSILKPAAASPSAVARPKAASPSLASSAAPLPLQSIVVPDQTPLPSEQVNPPFSPDETAAPSGQLAANIGDLISFGTKSKVIGIVTILIIIGVIALIVIEILKRKKGNKNGQTPGSPQ